MKYFLSEIQNIVVTFSSIHIRDDGSSYIRLYFERPNDSGFDFLESSLPDLGVKSTYGFSEEEIRQLLTYAAKNASRIWNIAEKEK